MMKKALLTKNIKSGIFIISVFVVVLTAVFPVILYSIQEMLLYHPDKNHITPQDALSVFKEETIRADGQHPLRVWYAPQDKNHPAILFFHGNSGQNAKFAPHLLPFIARGYAVLMMEYRGFGGTDGALSQKNAYADSLIAFDWLKNQGYEKIIVYGYSLGTSVAVNVAAHQKADNLILTAPFHSMRLLVSEKPIPAAKLVLKDSYDSASLIKTITIPTLIIHGKNDLLIPYHHAEMLFADSPAADKTLKLIDHASHRSVFFAEMNLPIIFDWLDKH